MSFLVRPTAVGTGDDSLGVQLLQGSSLVGGFALRTDPPQAQQYFTFRFTPAAGGFSSNSPLYAGETYFVVVRVTRPSTTQVTMALWKNPPATFVNNPTESFSVNYFSAIVIDSIGLATSSIDSGGPSSTAIFDELRIGYTWGDVVPQGPPAPLVPNLQITRAVKVSWASELNKSYQPEVSYDLSNWFGYGAAINGTGNVISIFDSADPDTEKFYRVQIH